MMKLLPILLTLAFAFTAPSAFAGKGNKAGKGGGHKDAAAAIKAADKNGNNTIDADEVAALNEALSKAGADSGLKALDKDGDGKFSDDEIKAINDHLAKKGEKKGDKKKNK
jgi:Ca2+-binding EF-hand superfamily protein